MRAGYESALGVCMTEVVGKVLGDKFESHQHLWNIHQILEIIASRITPMSLDMDNLTKHMVNSILPVVVLSCCILPREELHSRKLKLFLCSAFAVIHSHIAASLNCGSTSNHSHFSFLDPYSIL